MTKVSNFTIKGATKWIPFFSQTGTEIYNIIIKTGIKPYRIVTNLDPSEADKINISLFKNYSDIIYFLPKKPTQVEYETVIGTDKGTFITLHGWLRIIPENICKKYKIYNGHPGLITKYPELKGKDPQLRAFLGKYESSGSVIHKVTPGVDEGPVLLEKEIKLTQYDLEDTFRILSHTSLTLWLEFFKKVKWLKELL